MRKNHAWAVLALTTLDGAERLRGRWWRRPDEQWAGNGDGTDSVSPSHPIGDPAIKSALVVAQTDRTAMPLDAAPSPDGTVVYYITTGDGGSVLSSVPAAGGSATTIVQGAPLVKPTGVAVATDGSRVFVADQQALQDSVAGASGGVLQVGTTGTPAATLLAGTEGRSPRGLDVVSEGGADVVYFTGLDPANGAPGPVPGPRRRRLRSTTVAEGAPFASPDSVVVTAGGVAYVTDQGSGKGKGEVLKVSDGKVTPVLSDLRLGTPAGVTTVNDDATLLVSSIDAATLSDQVLFLDLASGKTAAATKVIGANKDSAGGLHRAHAAPVLAWADVQRPGRVYRVELCNPATGSADGQPAPAGLVQESARPGGGEEEPVGRHRPALSLPRRHQGEGGFARSSTSRARPGARWVRSRAVESAGAGPTFATSFGARTARGRRGSGGRAAPSPPARTPPSAGPGCASNGPAPTPPAPRPPAPPRPPPTARPPAGGGRRRSRP